MRAAWRASCAKGIERTATHMIEIGRSGCAPAQRRRKAAGGALLILMAGLTGCAPRLEPKAPPPLVTVAQPITRRIIDWDDYVGPRDREPAFRVTRAS
jgi:hypothetical protein